MGSHRTPADRLAELEKKKRQLGEQIAALSAREAVQARKDDDRRKMLLGTILLAELGDDAVATYARARLPSVMKPDDRRLFAALFNGSMSS